MSEPNEAIEVTAPSVDEAIKQALDQLGASEDDVIIHVLSTPRSGVLGLGARQARVRVERRAPQGARSGVMSPPPAPPPRPRAPAQSTAASAAGTGEPRTAPPLRAHSQQRTAEQPREREAPREHDQLRERNQAPERDRRRDQPPPSRSSGPAQRRNDAAAPRHEEGSSGGDEDGSEAGRKAVGLDEQAREATAILAHVLELMGERGEITVTEEDSEGIELAIKGDGSGLLIGRHGQTLDSLEYLVNRILARRVKDAVPITVDTESYRERRRRQLHRMALSMAEQTKREHASVTLDPMPPRDRRIVHLALKDDPLITTRSTGDGFLRAVEIIPVGERRESARGDGRPRGGGGGSGGGRNRDRERESEPQRERDQPVGQQGGFKHGQKRMF
ncbi:MAG TPA: RNA-binding cell elongation regulator Jag/EloR [Candidatus Binataceae bacterium]|nr:RNA-binding cell elongation regulator Jag/EloR [Candidatus Binataceae bacterium]